MPRQANKNKPVQTSRTSFSESVPLDVDQPMLPVYGVSFSDLTSVDQHEGLQAVASRTSDDPTGEGILSDLHNMLNKYQEFVRRTEFAIAQTQHPEAVPMYDENPRMSSAHRLHHNPFASNSEGSLGTDSYIGNPAKTVDNSILIAGILYFRYEYVKTFLAHYASIYTDTTEFMNESDRLAIQRVARSPQSTDSLVSEISSSLPTPLPSMSSFLSEDMRNEPRTGMEVDRTIDFGME